MAGHRRPGPRRPVLRLAAAALAVLVIAAGAGWLAFGVTPPPAPPGVTCWIWGQCG